MKITRTAIDGCVLIEPDVHRDDRGFFIESWNATRLRSFGIIAEFVQDNHSRSSRGVLRGLHYQFPKAQGKLVRVSRGAVFDVVVDLRRSSPSYGRSIGVELDDIAMRILWVPPGLAHGFLALRDDTDLCYKCTEFYDPAAEQTLRWNDPELALEWPLKGVSPLVSQKDQAGADFAEAVHFA